MLFLWHNFYLLFNQYIKKATNLLWKSMWLVIPSPHSTASARVSRSLCRAGLTAHGVDTCTPSRRPQALRRWKHPHGMARCNKPTACSPSPLRISSVKLQKNRSTENILQRKRQTTHCNNKKNASFLSKFSPGQQASTRTVLLQPHIGFPVNKHKRSSTQYYTQK